MERHPTGRLEAGRPLAHSAPSEGPDRLEVVVAAAYSRRRRKAALWRIERDAGGRCTDLVLMPGVDGISAWMLR